MSKAASRTLDPVAPPLDAEDRRIIGEVEASLAAGLEIQGWWRATDKAGSYQRQFELQRAFNPARRSVAFFDEAQLSTGKYPVIGVVQEMTFDYSRNDPADTCRQIREFVLRYLLRVSDYHAPAAFMLRDLHRTAAEQAQLDGWGYSQVYFKRMDGEIGKFAPAEQTRIVDLRELGRGYEWIVLKARLFNLSLDFSPLGNAYPHFVVPVADLTEEYLIAHAGFIVNQDNPEPGVLGRYGCGCATLRDSALRRGPLLWGPGRFYPGFGAFLFEVRATGETIVTAPFAVNQPERVFGLDPDPLSAGLRLADFFSLGMMSRIVPGITAGLDPLLTPVAAFNAVTGNLGADQAGLSKETLERYLLVQHFMSVYQLLSGAALTYCRVPDWTAPEEELPEWVRTGLLK